MWWSLLINSNSKANKNSQTLYIANVNVTRFIVEHGKLTTFLATEVLIITDNS